MKKFTFALFAISLALPAGAQAQQRLSEEQLIQLATEKQACGEDRVVSSARYVNETENRVTVTCDDAEGFVPLAAAGLGGAGAAAAAVAGLVAAAVGGGGSTPDTQ